MHYFSQSSIFCVHPSAAAGLRQDFVNDRNGEILLCETLPCIKEMRSAGASGEPTVSEGTASMCHLQPSCPYGVHLAAKMFTKLWSQIGLPTIQALPGLTPLWAPCITENLDEFLVSAGTA